ncbi:enoyl-CoA hydratase/isomerase family protein [Acetobacter orientalis]|uniref:enoyl-CoA hydratase/isomerase family protein n=1 Tax=Acetobacter orientalis TaxID=146474 RepID=UPI0038656F94
MTEDSLSGTDTVKTYRAGRLGRIVLDRPKQLNALDLTMAEGLARVLYAWRDDPTVQTVLLESATPRAFCAGGDLKALYQIIANQGAAAAQEAFSRAYKVMRVIAAYPKTTVSFLDGIAMGGGIGLGGHTRYRVVTERSVVAMPETSIGLTPDAGGSWLLSRAPGFSGLRLALTGNRMNGVGAVMTGFADRMVPSETLPDIAALLETRTAKDVFALIAPLPKVTVQELDACYDAPDIATVIRNLAERGGEAGQRDLLTLSNACPFSVVLSWEAWHRARQLKTRDAAFLQEEMLVSHLIRRADFTEGVRCRLIERDAQPAWAPATVRDVKREEIEACFQAYAT